MTGGYPYTDTTELLVPGSGSWRLAGLLPRPLSGVRVATVANTLYMLGGSLYHHGHGAPVSVSMFVFRGCGQQP